MKRRDFLLAGGAGALATGAAAATGAGGPVPAGDKVKIAAYQGKCADNFDENLERVLGIIEESGESGTDFLCFPEGYLSNYGAELAVTLGDPRIERLVESAGRYDMVSVVGVSEKEEGKIFNTALVLYGGKILGKYRKTMLTGSDKKIFAPDYSLPVFEAKGIPFAVIICHDSSFVEPALTMRWKGARLLFSPHYNSISSDRVDEHRKKVRSNHVGLATLLQMVVVRSNVIGWGEDRIGYGDTTIFSPLGEPVAAAPLFQEALITAEFDRSVFEKEEWASRREIPLEVVEQLWKASREKF